MAEVFYQTDIRASGQIFEYNQALRTVYALSGQYVTSGTGYTKAESDARYQVSGFPAEGSGLYQAGPYFHVGAGYGIIVSDSGVRVDTTALDARYALSGSNGTSISGLTDVITTAPTSGQELMFDGTVWRNSTTRYRAQFHALDTFQVDHGLRDYPQVTTLTSGGIQMFVQVTHLSISGLRLDFLGQIYSGIVICSL